MRDGRSRHDRRMDEQGVSLLDAVIGTMVILLVLVPVSLLLGSAGNTVGANSDRLTAQGLAAGWVNQELSTALTSSLGPGDSCSSGSNPAYTTTGWTNVNCPGTSLAWPTSATTTMTVGGNLYDIYIVGGWCVLSSSGGTWGNGTASTTSPATYAVAVKVSTVFAKSHDQNVVAVQHGLMPTQSTWTNVPTSIASTNSWQCPVSMS